MSKPPNILNSLKAFKFDCSIIIPTFNAAKFLAQSLQSCLDQKTSYLYEVLVLNDSSTDETESVVKTFCKTFNSRGIKFSALRNEGGSPYGGMYNLAECVVGKSRNILVNQSLGKYLCFLDSIVGSRVERIPEGSTHRFIKWSNNLPNEKLQIQIYTANGPTVLMPTWFMPRRTFDVVGGFCEDNVGCPEDLIFFYAHLDRGGRVYRVDEALLTYRYHPTATTFSIHEDTIFNLRLQRLMHQVLPSWPHFTIWNGGKQGRKFYRSLPPHLQAKVKQFCDVDQRKLRNKFYTYHESPLPVKPKVPVVHVMDAEPPFVICMKLDMTDGKFEEALAQKNLVEGVDYVLFT